MRPYPVSFYLINQPNNMRPFIVTTPILPPFKMILPVLAI